MLRPEKAEPYRVLKPKLNVFDEESSLEETPFPNQIVIN